MDYSPWGHRVRRDCVANTHKAGATSLLSIPHPKSPPPSTPDIPDQQVMTPRGRLSRILNYKQDDPWLTTSERSQFLAETSMTLILLFTLNDL